MAPLSSPLQVSDFAAGAAVQVHRNVTEAVATVLHFFIDICAAFLFTIFMTELTKVLTGVLRCVPRPSTIPLRDAPSSLRGDGPQT